MRVASRDWWESLKTVSVIRTLWSLFPPFVLVFDLLLLGIVSDAPFLGCRPPCADAPRASNALLDAIKVR
jgi:hypothetical protein